MAKPLNEHRINIKPEVRATNSLYSTGQDNSR